MFSAKAHHHIYFWSAIIIVIGLSLGKIFMSIGTISIFVNWLIQGNFREKLSTLKSNKIALSILVIFSFHLIGLLWSSDFDYAFHDIKIKVPILA